MAETTPRFIDVVEVARLVRRSLKKDFPDVHFSVRSTRYSGGASVVVRWKAGPQEFEVKATVDRPIIARRTDPRAARSGGWWLWPKVRPAAQAMAHDHQQPSFSFSCRNPVIGNLAVMVVSS